MTTNTNRSHILERLHTERGFDPEANPDFAYEIDYNEQAIRDCLNRIMQKATYLLVRLNSSDAIYIAREMQSGAGASGTIGTEWYEAVSRAASVTALAKGALRAEPR